MKYEEITKPLNPDQQKIKGLQNAKNHAGDALKAERERQKRSKAVVALKSIKTPSINSP